jgi:aminoglycoside phosphotransferase family enzyme
VSDFGNRSIRTNWEENFNQTEEFIGETISGEDYSLTRQKIEGFMKDNESLFEKRREGGRIRDCHGDIHSGNIFVTNGIYIFDAIEFNERIRYTDVTADVGFLAMDLDYRGHPDLAAIFVERYIEYSGDKDLMEVLSFYKCYRAYVRGKVVSIKLKDLNVAEREKIQAAKEAKAYFILAATYARAL